MVRYSSAALSLLIAAVNRVRGIHCRNLREFFILYAANGSNAKTATTHISAIGDAQFMLFNDFSD
jgi:hypothetical protein